jgi:hypothetical protein
MLLYGKGSDLSDAKAKRRRVKCKMITQKTMLALIDIAKEKGAKDRVKASWNTYHCQNNIITAIGRMYAPYCKELFLYHLLRKQESRIDQKIPADSKKVGRYPLCYPDHQSSSCSPTVK